ncbi:MAG: ABC transporter substrate-binding protein [Caldilineaceae bacterium SB0661_bin_32]|uniref:Thiamine pyrimidine synthase n=1 Tax=Caldilineaceae bacterium SB0661_bin_32 TaxID=2605255 RepID=A0A6B1D464_9CHLR|nr:ABC transporter substrate-binding protein [Caldilineaceae bacterium SB0661_bin_32]
MRKTSLFFLLYMLPLLILSACTIPVVIPENEGGAGAVAGGPADGDAEFQRLLACVEESFPAENYITNELLPDLNAAWETMDCESMEQVKVGMPWILNDGGAPWYNAVELGFFSDVCLEAELVRGGSGIGHLQTLIDGGVDFAVSAGGSLIPGLLTGHDGADIVAVGALIKHSPYIWLGLDHDTPRDQRSQNELTPQDFIGKTIGLHEGEGHFFELISAKHGISPDQVELVVTGYSPEPVIEGEMDYTGAWLINEPRLLEAQGYKNWVAFRFSEWGWDDYSEVLVVRRSTLEENPDLVRRYLAAVFQGLKQVLENPERSAEIAVRYAVDVELTEDQALRRYQLQEALVVGADELPLGHMSAGRWNRQVASLIQYDQMELPMCQ